MFSFTDGQSLFDALISGGAIGPSLLIVALWESLWPEHRQRPGFLGRWISNFSLFALSLACTAILTPTLTLLTNLILERSPLRWAPGEFGFWLHLTYACLVLDLLNYLLHRAMHTRRALWRVHSLHHSDVALDVSTTVRHHPLETVVTAVAIGIAGAVVGCSALEVAVYAVLETTIQVVAHADVRLPSLLDRLLSAIFVTPNFHRMHHSSEVSETDSNYGQVFAFWDRIFGTRSGLADSARGEVEFGLKSFRDAPSQRFDQLLLLPVKIFSPN